MTDPYETLTMLAPQVSDELVEQVHLRVQAEVATTRRPVHRTRWLMGAAAITVGATTAVLWPSSTPSAFAGWTALPTAATAAQVAAAQERCQTGVTGSAEAMAGYIAGGQPVPPLDVPRSAPELADQQVVLAEQRGSFTHLVTTNGQWVLDCLDAPELGDAVGVVGTTNLAAHPTAPAADSVDRLQGGGVGVPGGESAVVAGGRAGSQVVGVQLRTPEGSTVTASVADGYWTAWWPSTEAVDGSSWATEVVVLLADGTSRTAGTLDSLTSIPIDAGLPTVGASPAPSGR
ncbi:MAG: hypothetical protein KJ792_00760 [Actinobacteria bacterium]|nr:hypothetical protein [Actinomycetota bacterium]MCG2801786.1 hypothetical protein [Cellulomonas sp.]